MRIVITEQQYKRLTESYITFPVDDDISLEVWEDKNKLELSTIVIPKHLRGQGKGTQIMNMVIKYADDVSKPIYLTPDTNFGGTSINRLKKFYRRFGFTKNDNYEVKHSMVRYPIRVIKEMAVSAYQGTPYSFDKFDIEKVGSGESTQWFGWGLYFSDDKSVANSYSKNVPKLLNKKNEGKGDFFLKGEYVGSTNEIGGVTLSIEKLQKVLFPQDDILYYPLQKKLRQKLEDGLEMFIKGFIVWISREDIESAFNNYDQQLKNDSQRWIQDSNEVQRLKNIFVNTLSQLNPQDFVFKENKITKSYRYNVTLHKNKTPDQYDYLSWYDSLTPKQKQKIVNQIKTEKLKKNIFYIVKPKDQEIEVQPKFFKNLSDAKRYMKLWNSTHIIKGFNIPYNQLELITGTFSVEDLNGDVKDFYTQLSGLLGSPKEASMFLLRAGIDGIKYPTNTIAGGESKGTNYVVFDPNTITIDDKDEIDIE